MVPGKLAWPIRPNTCFRDFTKNSWFSWFMALLMSYFPLFWGFMSTCLARKTRYKFERYDQILLIFVFCGCFHELLPTVLRSRRICMDRKTRYMFDSYGQKLVAFVFYGYFHELLPIVLGFQGNLHGP